MTNPIPLSPAAQAVFYAFNSKFDWIEDGVPGPQFNAIAAALRAAADQAVPDNYNPIFPRVIPYPEEEGFVDGKCIRNKNIRTQLLAIAAELEGSL